MKVLHLFGTEEQKRLWLEPLLRGDIWSCFCITVTPQRVHKDHFIINGKKWWSSGKHGLHSMILLPLNTPGVKKIRLLTVFSQDSDDSLINCLLSDWLVVGERRGFEIAQGQLVPGRFHHFMRAVGLAEWALDLLCQHTAPLERDFTNTYVDVSHWIAECLITISLSRLLTLQLTRWTHREIRLQEKRSDIVAAGRMESKVEDCAIQVYRGAGVSDDFPLTEMHAYAQTRGIADGPDEVHLSTIALLELRDQWRQAQAKLCFTSNQPDK
uniref:Acyl-CoA dehydrogenase/oxidase C-terminal domain-containing protein n=1 Tax=Cyprinus carpio carpio TaxID=630221 RepID=A0A9J7YQP3_CYPCA